MTQEVTVGGPAPDLAYTAGSGDEKHLSELWATRPALVLWLRHFG
jgi:hypothetical protein